MWEEPSGQRAGERVKNLIQRVGGDQAGPDEGGNPPSCTGVQCACRSSATTSALSLARPLEKPQKCKVPSSRMGEALAQGLSIWHTGL